MKKILLFAIVIVSAAFSATAHTPKVRVDRIWENGYSAFPSIERFNGMWYVSFREGVRHHYDGDPANAGKIRVLSSKNGRKWKSVALIQDPTFDLRDPKLSVTPDGRLMIILAAVSHEGRKVRERYPMVCFSDDGRSFSGLQRVTLDGEPTSGYDWFWRLTWHEGVGYTVNYGRSRSGVHSLLKTANGVDYQTVASSLGVTGTFPNETTVRFLPDGRMAALVRREGKGENAWWGTAPAPYTDWSFRDLGFKIGGPDFIVLEDGRIVAGGRSRVSGEPKTIIWMANAEGRFTEICVLPSGNDNSYPGFAVSGKNLWVVYYSSHELKREDGGPRGGIYLAKIPLDQLR